MAKELKVVADFYDFTLWLLPHVEKFPRHYRYSLGRDIEGRLQTILALLLRAKYSKNKAGYLADANIELEILRFQVRLTPQDSEKGTFCFSFPGKEKENVPFSFARRQRTVLDPEARKNGDAPRQESRVDPEGPHLAGLTGVGPS